MTYQSFQALVAKLGHPPKPVDRLTCLPSNCKLQDNIIADTQYDPPTLAGNIIYAVVVCLQYAELSSSGDL